MDDWFNRVDDETQNQEKKKQRIFQDDTAEDTFTDFVSEHIIPSEPEKKEAKSPEKSDDYYKQLIRDMNKDVQPAEDFSKGLDFSDINRQIQAKKATNNTYAQDNAKTGEIPSVHTTPARKPVPKTRKSGSRGKKLVKSIIAIILVVVLAFGAYAYTVIASIDYQPDTHKSNNYIDSSSLRSSEDVYNVLIIGTDKREGEESYRSDSMILASIDTKHKAIKLTSFLRDSWVYIPAKNMYAKLNAACSYGGPQMVIDTLEYNFKVKIDKYVMIDFDVFKTIINDIGGITITITDAEAACITREAGYLCKSGTRVVKGRTALWYARIRHLDSDFNRTARQRKVIQAVVAKLKKTAPTVLVKTLKDVLPQITTDISSSKLISLGLNAVIKYLHYDICEQGIPASGTWSNARINGQDVLKLNLEKNNEILHSFIYEKSVADIKGKD